MLWAGTDAAEQSSGKEMLIAGGKTARHDRKAEHAVTEAEDHSPSDIGHDKAV